jgi:hypothetical protein
MKMTMKRRKLLTRLIGLCFIILTGYVVIGDYAKTYSITDDRQAIISKIQTATSKFKPVLDHIDLKQIVDIENEKHVLFVSDKFDGIGNAVLTKGLNGKFKIHGISWGGNLFEYHVNEIKNNKYLVAYGRNYDRKIEYIKAILEGKAYRVEVPNQDYFIVFSSVSGNSKITSSYSTINIYGKSGKDLTAFIYGISSKTSVRSYYTNGSVEDKSFLGTYRHGFGLMLAVIYILIIGVILHRIAGFIGSKFKFTEALQKLLHRS